MLLFEEDDGTRRFGQDKARSLGPHDRKAGRIQEFEASRAHRTRASGLSASLPHKTKGGGQAVEESKACRKGLRLGDELDFNRSDETQSPFGSAKNLNQVPQSGKARGILVDLWRSEPVDTAVEEGDFQTADPAVGRSVAEGPRTACVAGNGSTEAALTFRSGIRRVHQAHCLGFVLEVAQDGTRPHDGPFSSQIEVSDALEALAAHGPAVRCQRGAGRGRTQATGGYRHSLRGSLGQPMGRLGGRSRTHQAFRASLERRGVVAVAGQDRWICDQGRLDRTCRFQHHGTPGPRPT